MSLHVGDIGSIIRLTSDTNLSSESALKIYYRKPDGTEGNFAGTLNGTGDVQYTTTAVGDIDQRGNWTFQAYAVITGFTGRSTKVTISVKEAIGA